MNDAFGHLSETLYRPPKDSSRATSRRTQSASNNPFDPTPTPRETEEPPFETIDMQMREITDRLQTVFDKMSARSAPAVAQQTFTHFITWWKDVVFYSHGGEEKTSSERKGVKSKEGNLSLTKTAQIDEVSFVWVVADLRAVTNTFTTRLHCPQQRAAVSPQEKVPLLSQKVAQALTNDLFHFFEKYGGMPTKALQQEWVTDAKSTHEARRNAVEQEWLVRWLCRRPDAPLDVLLKSSKGTSSKLGVLVHRSGDTASSLFHKVLSRDAKGKEDPKS